jgi:hypothetical protein
MIKYDKNGRAYASASFAGNSPPVNFHANVSRVFHREVSHL